MLDEQLDKRNTMNILLVDDSRELIEVVEEVLVRMGHRIVRAYNGQEAYKHIEENEDLDLVISDNQMPIMTGPELIMSLVEMKVPYPPIILWSGNVHTIPSDISSYVFEILPKGTDFDNILNCVARIGLSKYSKIFIAGNLSTTKF